MKKVKLGEVVTLKKGKKATILNEQTILSQRYIQIDDLRNDNNLKFTESLNMTEALLDDILIAWDGANAGTIGYGLSGAVGSTIMVLKKNEQYKDEIISDYLGVFLESKSQYLRYHSTGATIPHLNKNILLDLKLELLHIEEQENIIRILNIIKRLITKRKCQLEELNLLVKSRFNEMFGDIFDNPQSKLEDHTELNPNKKELLNFNGNVSFLPMSNVSENGKINLSINRNIDDVRKGFTFFKDNDVIVAKITPCFENGKGAPVFGLLNGVGFGSTEFHVLRPKNTVNTVWLYHVTMLSKFRLEGERKMTGSGGQRRITKDFINNFKLNIPPLSLQNEFADFVAQVDKSQLAIQKSLEELETLKKSLMQEYFG